MPSKILVTGGAGFIGTHLCRALADEHEVHVLDLKDPRSAVKGVKYRIGDARDPGTLAEMTRDAACVYHLAAYVSVPYCQEHPGESYENNLVASVRVGEAALAESKRTGRKVRVIFSSSAAVYSRAGIEGKGLRESDVSSVPLSFYGAQKLGSEHALKVYRDLSGLPVVNFRFFNVYGPGQDPKSPYSGVISLFTGAVRENRGLTLNGDGRQTRDFVFVRDLTDALSRASRIPEEACDGNAVNLGTGRSISILDLAEETMKAAGKTVPVKHGPPRAGDVRHSCSDISRARDVLGWEPRVTLAEGLRELR
ncbi:MAG: NAD-dependent epimerase/dehydratase family protein [Deltaproteobacteria bacterium]|nr:NAD-dependent epimerase/dehydratase family protein [Deltaproteobacteria bacterium]